MVGFPRTPKLAKHDLFSFYQYVTSADLENRGVGAYNTKPVQQLDRCGIRKIIKIKEACAITSLSEATINRLIRKNKFPEKLELSTKRRGFYEDTILEWNANRKAATRQ